MILLPPDLPKHFLWPCTIFADREPHLVSTTLGSCVSVCLWDRQLSCGGINHFMLPLWNGVGLATPKYGNIAIEKLRERMLLLGCRPEGLVAKVFGGAKIMAGDVDVFNVGERNVEVALSHLERHRIPLVAMDTGGERATRIQFNSQSGTVHLWQQAAMALKRPDGSPGNRK